MDWLVELAGALAPAAATGFAAMMLAPSFGFAPGPALLAGFAAMFGMAFGVMRAVTPEPRTLALPAFEQQELPEDISSVLEALGSGELLLDRPYAEPDELLLDQPVVASAEMDAVAELLLDDPLPAPASDSRVVQLFAAGQMPTAGQLQQRIERHIAGGASPPRTSHDASDALSEALAELRRSLRQA